jgi:hypothetical protein
MKYGLDLIVKNITRKRPAFENLFLKERKKESNTQGIISVPKWFTSCDSLRL